MSKEKTYSIEEMQTQIRQLKTTINLPGVPDDEKAIYMATIQRIQSEIDARTGPVSTPPPPPVQPQPIKTTTPPPPPPPPLYFTPPVGGGAGGGVDTAAPPLKPSIIHAGGQHPVNSKQPMSATIQADHDADPYNPAVRITWADGYTISVTETEARGRFVSTLRDTCGLRLVQKGRYDAMWRWSSPWRAAGFYQALTHFYGAPPTMAQLGINRPGEITRHIFQLITTSALQPQP